MVWCASHASGIIIRTACGRLRPPRWSSSRASSKLAVSEASGVMMGKARSSEPATSPRGKWSDASDPSRACIQLRLPMTVLISPLWASRRYGWASGQDGNVLVENREWTSARLDWTRRSVRSAKNAPNCAEVSIPL